jgi:hypothetical protein
VSGFGVRRIRAREPGDTPTFGEHKGKNQDIAKRLKVLGREKIQSNPADMAGERRDVSEPASSLSSGRSLRHRLTQSDVLAAHVRPCTRPTMNPALGAIEKDDEVLTLRERAG